MYIPITELCDRNNAKVNEMQPEDKVFGWIAAITIIITVIFMSHGELTFFNYLTEFSAGMLGVMFAFNLERKLESRRKEQDRKELFVAIRDELEENLGKIKRQKYPLYIDVWSSAISSGQIRLLKSIDVRKFTHIYGRIKEIDYEAIRVRDAEEDAKRTGNYGRFNFLQTDQNRRIKTTTEIMETTFKDKMWD